MARDKRGAVQVFEALWNHSSTKHATFMYGERETGLRHPDHPAGIMLRDQGHSDLYAGKSRFILSVDGAILGLCRWWATYSDTIKLQAGALEQFHIQGKVFNDRVFAGQPLAGIKSQLPDRLGLVTSDLLIDTRTGRIISGFVPFSDVFTPEQVFDAPKPTDPTIKMQSDLWLKAMGVKK